jgi:NADH dehydrogenase FAD-containing subunit
VPWGEGLGTGRFGKLGRQLEQLLTFVVISDGPTGVEMVGALAELARFALA